MSATELPKALNRIVHIRGAGAPAGCRLAWSEWSKPGRLPAVSDSPRAPVPNAVLIALSLFLAGCSVLQPDTTARTTPPPQADTRGAQELASPTKPPEALSRPAQPAPQQAQHVRETKPPPATASKGAEMLVSPSRPLPVRARERTTPPAEPIAPKAAIAENPGTVTNAPVQALVFKGPPLQARSHRAGIKPLIWLGVGLGVAVLAVLIRLCLVRRVAPAQLTAAGEDELRMPRELGFKEPVNVPREPTMAGKR